MLKQSCRHCVLVKILLWNYSYYFRFQERKVLMWGGFLFMVIGGALYFPWGSEPPIIAEEIMGMS
jgi:hypothetical protein